MGRRRPDLASARGQTVRAKIVFYVFFAIALGIIARFYIVQVRDGPMLSERAHEQRLRTLTFPAHRGTIFDRDGTSLVRSLPSQSVYATTRDVQDARDEARSLASVLTGTPEADILASLQTKTPYVQVAHKVSHDEAGAITKLDLAGISIVPEPTGVRFVTSGRLASSVIGFTGFDENGLDGVEYSFDGVLRGTPGRMELEGDTFGRAIPFAQPKVVVAAKPGHSIALTIDSYLQYETQAVLNRTVGKWHAQSGSAIVLDPNTGEILALANSPDYDVRNFGEYPADARRDRAVMDAYEPGSTFKLITAAAAIDSGKVSPTDRFPARDELDIGGRTIHNAEDGFEAGVSGTETLGDIIAYSHNVGAAEVGLRIGSHTMYDMMRRFGFGDTTDVGLPGENPGIVPKIADWSETSLPTMAFGHGIAVTPIALVRAYAAIANGGELLRPRILDAIVDADGHEEYRYGREVERRVMSPKTAAILRGYLRAVVLHGTGNPTAQIPGYTTAGKTGTAQVAENGVYSAGDYVASFVGYVPAESPRFVILVKIAKPRGAIYGSVVAAPAFAEIARDAMMHAGVMPGGPRLVRADPPANAPVSTSSKRRL
jgi:stage V sporulation protein D (sporulation-specific penicillin-binding protein)